MSKTGPADSSSQTEGGSPPMHKSVALRVLIECADQEVRLLSVKRRHPQLFDVAKVDARIARINEAIRVLLGDEAEYYEHELKRMSKEPPW